MRRLFPTLALLLLACQDTDFAPLAPGASALSILVEIEVVVADTDDTDPGPPTGTTIKDCSRLTVRRVTPNHELAKLFLEAVFLPVTDGVFCFPNCPTSFSGCPPNGCPPGSTVIDINPTNPPATGLQAVLNSLKGLPCTSLDPTSPNPDDAQPPEAFEIKEFLVLLLQTTALGPSFNCADFSRIFDNETDCCGGSVENPPKWNIDVLELGGKCVDWPVDDTDPATPPQNNRLGGFQRIVLTISQQ